MSTATTGKIVALAGIAAVLLIGHSLLHRDRQDRIEDRATASCSAPQPRSTEQPVQVDAPPRSNASGPGDTDDLVDGNIAREWGDFIKAKDIRYNCRSEQSVIRDVSRPDDFHTRCDTRTEFDHPYVSFTDEQLEQIAGTDPAAGYLLAHRLLIQPSPGKSRDSNPERGLSLAMNALVQSWEKQVFDLLIEGRHFRNWLVWATVNGVPSDNEIREKEEEYIWYKAGRDLGFVAEDSYRWRKLSGQIDRFRACFEVEDLDSRAKQISDGVRQRRLDFTGGEPDGA